MSKACFELKVLVRKILQYKEKHKLTYQQMASSLGVDKSYVHKVVNMKTYPSFPVLRKLSQFLDLPLCFLFLPSEEEIREEFAAQVNQRLQDLELSFEDLQEETKIPHLRLMDIVQGATPLTLEEERILAQTLNVTACYDYGEIKMVMLKSFLNDMDLSENQVENVIHYIKGYM